MSIHIFDDQSVLDEDVYASNICLYYGHDGVGGSHVPDPSVGAGRRYRMSFAWWGAAEPSVEARLIDANGLAPQHNLGPAMPRRIRFYVVPGLERSIITADVAQHFELPVQPAAIPGLLSVPFVQMIPALGGVHLTYTEELEARVRLQAGINVTPQPISGVITLAVVNYVVMEPLANGAVVLRSLPERFAVLGRDVMDYIFFLFRGKHAAAGAIPNAGRAGRVFFGREER